jgi:Fur family ferric uptake transcriptional regulator
VPVQTRKTRQKEAIRTAFSEAGRPLSPDETLQLTRSAVDSMSIATIYRNISSLVTEGWLTAVEIPGEPARYELSGKDHHHHFHCNACGKVYELEGCTVPQRPELPKGFLLTGHEFFLYGTCISCA